MTRNGIKQSPHCDHPWIKLDWNILKLKGKLLLRPESGFYRRDVLEETGSSLQFKWTHPTVTTWPHLYWRRWRRAYSRGDPSGCHRINRKILGVVIEHFAGAFPVWLAPVQAVIIPIADRHLEYAHSIQIKLKAEGIRSEVDDRSERMNAKIRDAQNQKIPYMLVVGDKEMEQDQVALRLRSGENPGPIGYTDFVLRAKKDISEAK
jgi:hypothetical protein